MELMTAIFLTAVHSYIRLPKTYIRQHVLNVENIRWAYTKRIRELQTNIYNGFSKIIKQSNQIGPFNPVV